MRNLLLLILVPLALLALVIAWDSALQLVFLITVLWWLFRPAGLFKRQRTVTR